MQPQKSLCSSLRGEKFSCVWGPAVFAVRESNFPKWGRGQGYRRAQPCAQGWMVYGRRSPFFQLFFRLIFAAFALALIAGGKRDPARPCGTVRVPPRLFSLVVGNGGALGLPAFFLSPSARGGIISHARAALAVMIARRGRLRKVSVQISPLPVLKLYSTTSGETEIQSSLLLWIQQPRSRVIIAARNWYLIYNNSCQTRLRAPLSPECGSRAAR